MFAFPRALEQEKALQSVEATFQLLCSLGHLIQATGAGCVSGRKGCYLESLAVLTGEFQSKPLGSRNKVLSFSADNYSSFEKQLLAYY